MKILAVSDMVVSRFQSERVAECLCGVDLILGCGDLPYDYLEFLNNMANVPLSYVPGNHDPAFNEHDPKTYAGGCDFLDRKVQRFKGLNIGGVGGSIRYKPGRPNQYTQGQMYSRLIPFVPRLIWHLARHGGVLDILIAHSPPLGTNDDTDPAHIGFAALRDLIRIFKPRYFLHGHIMVYKSNIVSPVAHIGNTTIINIYPYRFIEV